MALIQLFSKDLHRKLKIQGPFFKNAFFHIVENMKKIIFGVIEGCFLKCTPREGPQTMVNAVKLSNGLI